MMEEEKTYRQRYCSAMEHQGEEASGRVFKAILEEIFQKEAPFINRFSRKDTPIVAAIMDVLTKYLIRSMSLQGKVILEAILSSSLVLHLGKDDSNGIYRPLFENVDEEGFDQAVRLSLVDIGSIYVAELKSYAPEDTPFVIGVIKTLCLSNEKQMDEEEKQLKQKVLTAAEKIAATEWNW